MPAAERDVGGERSVASVSSRLHERVRAACRRARGVRARAPAPIRSPRGAKPSDQRVEEQDAPRAAEPDHARRWPCGSCATDRRPTRRPPATPTRVASASSRSRSGLVGRAASDDRTAARSRSAATNAMTTSRPRGTTAAATSHHQGVARSSAVDDLDAGEGRAAPPRAAAFSAIPEPGDERLVQETVAAGQHVAARATSSGESEHRVGGAEHDGDDARPAPTRPAQPAAASASARAAPVTSTTSEIAPPPATSPTTPRTSCEPVVTRGVARVVGHGPL